MIYSLVPDDLIKTFEARVIDQYVTYARSLLPLLEVKIARIMPSICRQDDFDQRVATAFEEVTRSGWFDRRKRKGSGYADYITNMIDDVLTGGIVLDVKKVITSALDKVREAVDFFNTRVSEKINLVPAATQNLRHTIQLHLNIDNGVIQGTVAVGDGGDYSWHVSLKTNYRYGENAANGVITVYWQVPCIFRGTQEGCYIIAAEERKRAAATVDVRKELRAKKSALADQKYALGRLREAYEALEHAQDSGPVSNPNYLSDKEADVVKWCAKVGISDPGSTKAVRSLIKETKDAMNQIRALEAEEKLQRSKA